MRPPQNLPPRHEEATRIAVRQLIYCWRLFNCSYLYHALSTILAPANCRGFSISPSTPSHLFTPAREAQPASPPHRLLLLTSRPRTAAALRRRGQTCAMAAGLRQSIGATRAAAERAAISAFWAAGSAMRGWLACEVRSMPRSRYLQNGVSALRNGPGRCL